MVSDTFLNCLQLNLISIFATINKKQLNISEYLAIQADDIILVPHVNGKYSCCFF